MAWTLKDGIDGATLQFTSDFMKSSAISAIDTLCFIGRNLGAQNPQLVNVYGNPSGETEAYARELLIDEVLGGPMKIRQFVEQVVTHAATQHAYFLAAQAEAAKAKKAES